MSLISLLKKKSDKVFFTTPSHGGKFFIFHKFYQWYKADSESATGVAIDGATSTTYVIEAEDVTE